MQIKAADDRRPDILALERLLERPGVALATRKRIEAEIRNIAAGAKGERDAAYEIELWFGRSPHWATIHDLRFEVNGLVAQIDHMLINRMAEIWLCESKAFSEGVSVNEHGEWTRWWHGRADGMPSPIQQNRRHVELLRRVFEDGLVKAPRRLGLVPVRPAIRSLVLVSNTARIGRPKREVDGLDQVIKAEHLRTRLFDEFDNLPDWKLTGLIGKEGLETLARSLAALHRPASIDWSARFGLSAEAQTGPGETASVPSAQNGQPPSELAGRPARLDWKVKYDGPCSACGRLLVKGTSAVWDRRQRKMFCLDCAST